MDNQEVRISPERLIALLKAELGNLVYQLAVKQAQIEELQRNAPPTSDPADR